jgi:putative Holliday junction resolvase
MNRLVRELLPTLALDEAAAGRLDLPAGSALPAALPVNTLACGSVALAALAAAALRGDQEPVRIDPRQVSVAFRNDQLQTVDGEREPSFGPMSGFFAARDGWVRTHANYPHHRDRLAALAAEYEPLEVVLGLPRSLSGGEGPAAGKVRGFAERLARAITPVPVRLVDERMSTVTAAQSLRASGVSAKKGRSRIDQAAAVVILQSALDAERVSGRPPGQCVEVVV